MVPFGVCAGRQEHHGLLDLGVGLHFMDSLPYPIIHTREVYISVPTALDTTLFETHRSAGALWFLVRRIDENLTEPRLPEPVLLLRVVGRRLVVLVRGGGV